MARRPIKRAWTRKPESNIRLDSSHWLYPFLKVVLYPGIGQFGNMVDGGFVFNTSTTGIDGVQSGERVRGYDGSSGQIDTGDFTTQNASVGLGFIAQVSPRNPIDGTNDYVALMFNSLTLGLEHTAGAEWNWSTHFERSSGGWKGVPYGTPPAVGEFATVGSCWNDTSQEMRSYQDGLFTNTSGTGQSAYSNNGRSYIRMGCGKADSNTGNFYFTPCDFEFVIYFEGIALTDEQVKDLSDDPYQLLEKNIIWLPVGINSVIKLITDTANGNDALGQLAVQLGITDSATGADQTPGSAAQFQLTDIGSGTDNLNMSALLALLESAAGADLVLAPGAQLGIADTGNGLDALSASALLAMVESATGADVVLAPSAQLAVVDTGSGLDALSASALLSVSDTGNGNDALNLSISLAVLDAASGVDVINVLTEILKAIGDTATGTDAISAITNQLSVADVGTGVDQPAVNVVLTLTDTASAVDALNIIQQMLVTIADTATGTDNLAISVSVPITDSGTGIDALSIASLLSIVETLKGVDAVVTFNTATRIASIQFALRQRSMQFSLAQRSMNFTLH